MLNAGTYVERRAALLGEMATAEVDVAVVTTPESIKYLAGVEIGGFSMPQYLVLTRDGASAYIVRTLEASWKSRWDELSWCTNWVGVMDGEDFASEVVRQVQVLTGRRSVESVALEIGVPGISHSDITTIVSRLGEPTLRSADRLVHRLRVIKSEEEVALMRQIAMITAAGMDQGVASIASGRTELDAQRDIASALDDAGSGLLPGDPWAASGPDTYWGHLPGRRQRPRPGDLITFMVTGTREHYVAPLERTFAYGDVDREVLGILQSVRDALKLALDRLKPGATSHEVDAIVRDYYERKDLSRHFLNRLAYSIGIAYPPIWWENDVMQIRPGDQRVIEAGMTFHVVPSLHIEGIGFLQSSMPVVVTEDGCERLSDYEIDVPRIEVHDA